MSTTPSLLTSIPPLKMAERQCCAHCHQRLPVSYPANLSRVLVSFLRKLSDAGGGPIRLGKLNLTTSEHGNSNKLQFFGLAVKLIEGKWLITDEGRRFLRGETSASKRVWTRTINGVPTVVDREGMVTIQQIDSSLMTRVEYVRQARL